jgi:multidrug efflux pump subunit AcrB
VDLHPAGQEFLPEEDKGRLLTFMITPEGSTAEYTDRMMQRVEGIVDETPEVQSYFSAIALGPARARARSTRALCSSA